MKRDRKPKRLHLRKDARRAVEIAISILAARVTEKQMAIHNVIDETRRISPKTLNYTFTV